MEEIWRPVSYALYCEIYEISNLGRLRKRFSGGYRKVNTDYDESQDRVKAVLHHDQKVKTLNIGIEVAKVFGVEMNGNRLCYKDGNSQNLCVENLYFIRVRYKKQKIESPLSNICCQRCKRYPTNYKEYGFVPCDITGILKFKTNFASCGCKHFTEIPNSLNLVK